MSQASLRTELAAAVRSVAAALDRLPADQRPDVAWAEIDDLLDAALAAADREHALAAIAEWRDRHLERFREAAQ